MPNTLKIEKTGYNKFWHTHNGNALTRFAISDFEISIDGTRFNIVEVDGAKRYSYLITDITIQDSTADGTLETFIDSVDFYNRLIEINYTPFLNTSSSTPQSVVVLKKGMTTTINRTQEWINANFDGTGLGILEMVGWAKRNDNNGTKDLRDRFSLNQGAMYPTLGATGGYQDAVVVQHSHKTVGFGAYGTGVDGLATSAYQWDADNGTSETVGIDGTGRNMPPYLVELHIERVVDLTVIVGVSEGTPIPSLNKFLVTKEIEQVGLEITFPADFTWLLNGIYNTNIVDNVFNLVLAETGKTRIDIFVANNSNGFTHIQGDESDSTPKAPLVPINSLFATFVTVTDSSSSTPPSTGAVDFTLTTTGTSGEATLIGSVLNIPNYEGGGTPLEIYSESGTLAGGDGIATIGDLNIDTLTGNGIYYQQDTIVLIKNHEVAIFADNISLISDSNVIRICKNNPDDYIYLDYSDIIGEINQKFQNKDGTIALLSDITGGGSPIISKTYAELTALISSNGLIQGQKYLLTDYETTYIQPVTSASKSSGVIEPLILTVVSDNAFSQIAFSELHPEDIVYYEITGDIGNGYGDEGFTKGKIYRRIDTLRNNDIGTDWRYVKYYRSGVDKLLFEDYTGCRNNTIKTYYLFDNVVGNYCFSNTIGNDFVANTIGYYFTVNIIADGFYSNTIGDEFSGNLIKGFFLDNVVGRYFGYNRINNILQNSTIGEEVLSNEFFGEFVGNIADYTQNNTCAFADLPNAGYGMSPSQYFIIYDALAPTYLGVAVGGGTVTCKVFWNGTNWITN